MWRYCAPVAPALVTMPRRSNASSMWLRPRDRRGASSRTWCWGCWGSVSCSRMTDGVWEPGSRVCPCHPEQGHTLSLRCDRLREGEGVTARRIPGDRVEGRSCARQMGGPGRGFWGVRMTGQVPLFCPLVPTLGPCSPRARRRGGGSCHGKGVLLRAWRLRHTCGAVASAPVGWWPGARERGWGDVCGAGGARPGLLPPPLGLSLQSGR